MARVVLTALGTHGDLNPSLALGRELKARGHSVVLASSTVYRDDALREGFDFAPMRPEADPDDKALMARLMDATGGSRAVVRDLVMPAVKDSYADLEIAAKGADLLVSHMLTYAVPVLAEKRGLPWVSTVLQPMTFFSRYDPPVLAPAPFLSVTRGWGPGINGALLALIKWTARSWSAPVRRLRAELGLPPGADPMFEGQHSPRLALALFSAVFGLPREDWPASARVSGFPFYDADFGGKGLEPALAEFLDAGDPPLCFTLGSFAVRNPGEFYRHATSAAAALGRRAVLLAGDSAESLVGLPPGVRAFRSAPYHALFPRCAALIHSGGIGTTAQASRSGKPQLIVPFAHDQHDNAARVARLGAGRTLSRAAVTAASLERELRALLGDAAVARKAEDLGKAIRAENGVKTACDLIESVLAGKPV